MIARITRPVTPTLPQNHPPTLERPMLQPQVLEMSDRGPYIRTPSSRNLPVNLGDGLYGVPLLPPPRFVLIALAPSGTNPIKVLVYLETPLGLALLYKALKVLLATLGRSPRVPKWVTRMPVPVRVFLALVSPVLVVPV